jgi:hypothetical protein
MYIWRMEMDDESPKYYYIKYISSECSGGGVFIAVKKECPQSPPTRVERTAVEK